MINRNLFSNLKSTSKSILLLGPRQTGKSTLIHSLKPDLEINLADEEVYFAFASNPGELRNRIETHKPKTIFIDEIQRIPSLLNTIQSIVDSDRIYKFYLTGSSARKLKRGGANLLPGRVLNFNIGPLVASELNYEIDTKKALSQGLLPEIYLEKDAFTKKQLLKSYVSNYIKEEIKAEALVRNLEAFTRFFKVSIQNSGLFIDYSKLAKKANVSRHAFSRFYEIFEDTLIGHRVWPYEPLLESADLIKHPKFYIFDNGIYNGVLENFTASVDRIGVLAEQLVYNQILHSAWSLAKDIKINTFRTRGGLEVDFLVTLESKPIAIEVKNSDHLFPEDVAPLKNLKNYDPKIKEKYLFHLGNKKTKIDGIWCLPWQEGLRTIGL